MNEPRDYTAADEGAYEAMLRRGGEVSRTRERLGWKYLTHPTSGRWVVDDGAKLLGHTGFVAFQVQVGGVDGLAGTSGDAFTDPDTRGKGVYSALSRHVDEVLGATTALQFAWFHSGWSGFQQGLGWRLVGRLAWRRRWVAPLVDRWFRRPRATLPTTAASAVDLDAAWSHVAGRWPLTVRRDAAWFRWRTSEPTRPSEVHVAWRGSRPVGAVAFRSEHGRYGARGLLLDASFAPDEPEVAFALVANATAALAAKGVHSVAALAVPGSPWDHALAANGLRPRGVGYDLGVRPYGRLPDAPPAEWAITGAEGDST